MRQGKVTLTRTPALSLVDPFADVGSDNLGPISSSGAGGKGSSEDPTAGLGNGPQKIHIRIQQRNGRKTLTTVQGLDKSYDPKKILKAVKKEFGCNGHVVSAEEADAEAGTDAHKKLAAFGQIIQLQGDQRQKIKDFFIQTGIVTEREAKERIQMWVFRARPCRCGRGFPLLTSKSSCHYLQPRSLNVLCAPFERSAWSARRHRPTFPWNSPYSQPCLPVFCIFRRRIPPNLARANHLPSTPGWPWPISPLSHLTIRQLPRAARQAIPRVVKANCHTHSKSLSL